ncbi:MAG: hypothetical protein ABFE13_18590 [Phycisphaerales bacterium]
MGWYGWFMIVGIVVVGGGWIAYWIWDRKMQKEEAKEPPRKSERLEKTKSEVSDWAKKMAEFKSPVPPKKFNDQDKQDG